MLINRAAAAVGIAAMLALPALSAAAASDPSAAALPTSTGPAAPANPPRLDVTGLRTVTLITGDRVALRTHRNGLVDTSIVAGSRHFGDRAIATRVGRRVSLTPQLPIAMLSKLDRSLFEVTELPSSDRSRVPLEITFAPGKVPHEIAGMSIGLSGARRAASGSTIVTGSYGRDFRGVSPADLAGITSIRLADRASAERPSTAHTSTLTVTLSTRSGRPAPYGMTLIENVDNSKAYFETPSLEHGKLQVDVPHGDYSVIVYTFSKLVIAPELRVDGDTTVRLDLGDATLRPKIGVPGYALLDGATSVSRTPEKGFSFALSFLGGDRLYPALQPASGSVAHGSLRSGIVGDFMPRGDDPYVVHASMAVTADGRRGIPHSFHVSHPKGEFAVVQQRFQANGPSGLRDTMLVPYAPGLDFFGGYSYPVRVPGVRTVLFQSAAKTWYEQSLSPFDEAGGFGFGELITSARYPQAGPAPTVDFARGPVGPGVEAGYDAAQPGRYCGMCRTGDRLHGFMTLFSGAGSSMAGFIGAKQGGWELLQDGTVLDAGHGTISPDVTLPSAPQRYALVATSQPHASLWRQSTWVRDAWAFDSRSGRRSIPLLLTSYLPPIRLDGSIRSRHTEFPLGFGNLGPADNRVTQAAAFWSVDGGQVWHRAQVTRVHRQAFQVSYTIPAGSGASRYVSLRVSGTDSAGNHVLETARRVYLLPG